MKITLIGHCSYDVVHRADGSENESPGGLLRSLTALASVVSRQDRITPVFGVHRNEHQQLLEQLRQYPVVDVSGIYPLDTPTHRVHYSVQKSGSCVLCAKDFAPPIPLERIRKFLDVDGVLVNMISGVDITLQTMDEIRMAVRGDGVRMHFDLHNLTLGIGKDHERVRRPVAEWRRWAFMIDTVQANEEEIGGLTLEPLTEPQTAGHLLTLGVKGLIVTRGAKGVTLYFNEHKKVIRKDVPPVESESATDVTGTGDVFGATFFAQYLRTNDLFASVEWANTMTGEMIRSLAPDDLHA
jgi:sugar/nucleoside kinase (ribokinase family)